MKARILSLSLLIGLAPSLALAAESAPVAKKISNFTGRDFRGKEVSLADFADNKAVVVVFLGTECPLAKLYGPRLVELQKEFADRSVAFIGVDANRQDLGTEVAPLRSRGADRISVVEGCRQCHRRSVRRSAPPEAYVLDKNRTVRYHGRIDDQYGFMGKGIAYQRTEPNRRDLAEALTELLAGKEVAPARDGRARVLDWTYEGTGRRQRRHVYESSGADPERELRLLSSSGPDRAVPADLV